MTRECPLRVGLIGAGMITHYHLLAWSKIANAQVVAVCDPVRDRAEVRARAFGINAAYDSMQELLERETIDAVDVATPRETHVAMVRQAMAKGIAVFCQKPLAPTLDEADDLVRQAEGKIRLMVHENWRFRPFYRQIKAWLDEDIIGKPMQFRLSHFSGSLLADARGCLPALERQPFMRTERRLLIAESLIHQLDVSRWLMGDLHVRAAYAERNSDAVVGETAATIFMETRDGRPVVVEGNMTVPGMPPRARDRLQMTCQRGTIDLKDDVLSLKDHDTIAIPYDFDAAYQASFDSAVAHFVDCIATEAAFETDGRENLATLKLVEDAYALARFQARP